MATLLGGRKGEEGGEVKVKDDDDVTTARSTRMGKKEDITSLVGTV